MDIRTGTFPSENREKNKEAGEDFLKNRKKILALQIMENCRNELYSQHPFLDVVFAALPVRISDAVNSMETDGWNLFVSPAFLLPVFARNPEEIKSRYLDLILYCLNERWKENDILRKKWEKILLCVSENRIGRGARGKDAGNQIDEMDPLKKGRYDYRRFLKRFAVMREEIELDTENFDYIPYDLGMRMYGNLPMVEPLEYKEVNKMEELVIAIDTSHSCSKEIVQRFLDETYAILNEKENFFRKFKVVILQCDCFLQNAVILHNEEEWKEYRKRVEIHGRSGTDFRPVFQYVEELRRKRELKNLKALIYFTDGDGIYPTKATEYETAFVFLKENEHMEKVPRWALRLVTEQNSKRSTK